MAVLLDIKRACKRYGEQVLLDDASATITDDGRIGFIGRNGAGKSTLLRVILGDEELDAGEIVRHPRLRLGYLRQHDPFQPGETVIDFLKRDSGQAEWKCGEVAGRFEIKGPALAGPVQSLSGGWQTRVKLAALLLHEPNLLLLDEPTNFLDLRTQLLLERFLRGFGEACLVVSHDRAFLGSTCDRTLELARGKLAFFPGKVDAFLDHREERRRHAERVNAATLSRKRELEEFVARNRARASTASRAKSKAKELERLEFEDIDVAEPTAAIRCPVVERRRGPVVRCRDLAIGYPGRTVASGVDLDIDHGARVAIVGDNGQGKTTLLRSLVASLEPLAGTVRWGHGSALGIYAQHVYTGLPEERTVLEHLERVAATGTKQQRILDLAGAMLFRGSAVEKRVAVLSGGERARLCLAGLLLGSSNVLVLDEPGNHLDVETLEALARALVDYGGTVLFTSHDRTFVSAVATCVLEVKAGRVVPYPGSYAEYLAAMDRAIDTSLPVEAGSGGNGRRGGDRPAGGGRAAPRERSDRDRRRELTALERTIARLDAEKRRHHEALLATTDPAIALEVHEALVKATAALEAAEAQWLALAEEAGETPADG
jgi:ATP-binding cassette subfamily F protein 3